MPKTKATIKYPGIRSAMDGNTAVIMCERESSDAAGAYPITPSTQMGEYWAEAAASGHINISGRPLIFIEPEGEHAAAAVTAGLSMTGLRSANFSSGQGIAYMHESLYAAVGKRLTYVLNMGTRAITKATLNVHAGHDDYHCIDDTGFFQLFAKNAQHAADLNIIAHRIAETALNPGIVAQDGFLTTHLIESLLLPERELIAEFLGRPDDIIPTPTSAQRIIYGETRRRIPELWDVDNPVMAGVVQNQDSYMQSVAAQRPFFFDHIEAIADETFTEFNQLTGRHYSRVMTYKADDAEYLILGQGSVIPSAEAVADYLRESRQLKVGVVDLVMFRPFPSALLSHVLKGKKGVAVLERLDQPLASDLPLMREVRTTISKCVENAIRSNRPPYPHLAYYVRDEDIPELYSGSFGLGSRDLQPEGLIAAIENMLPEGKGQKHFYLGIDFIHDKPVTPKQETYQQTLQESYPNIAELALHGSENPNLMPKDSITVRFHSIGGWGAITTGKNLAMTLFDLLGYHIKANPRYGSEKKGQPTTYYLSAAPEPIRINCEYFYTDVVLSPDPNVFNHTNALAGLREGGVFIIQSELGHADKVWASFPEKYRRIIAEKNIKVFFLDAFKIAREEATDPDLQLRMQGIAFQGAFFAATPVMGKAGLTEEKLLQAIKEQLRHKFGSKGARVVEDNLRVVQRGFDEIQEITEKPVSDEQLSQSLKEIPIPVMVKLQPKSQAPATDIHRFWEQTGNFYLRGMANDNLTDPFIGLSLMPAVSALFRDMTGIRFQHPHWIAENCTGCGDCYTVCPDTACPGLVSDVNQVLDTVTARVKQHHSSVQHLPKATRMMENHFHSLLAEAKETDSVRGILDDAINKTIDELANNSTDKKALAKEFDWFREQLGNFQFALTRPYFTNPEKKAAGSGGLFSITINPYTCKGCKECIEVCRDNALEAVSQTPETVAQLQKNWDLWLGLPNTPEKYIRVENLEEGIGALETILLNKDLYLAFSSGDGACMGCSEKTVLHLFIATVESLMQPRIQHHVSYLTDLISRLERYIETKLVQEINVDNPQAISKILAQAHEGDLTLAGLAAKIEAAEGTQPLDKAWLQRVMQWVAKLKHLKWKYTDGVTGHGRTSMGILNSTGCSSVWGSTWPYNPYPFPWANHLFQDSPSMAMGVFEGHMAKMADGFKAIRMAELELNGTYNSAEHDELFSYFNWRQFSDEEFLLCPPVVVVGGDGAMYDIGFQNLSRALMSGKPLKIIVLDTQVYSNTGGQACTSGFTGQVSDMAPFGKVSPGKQEIRKEIGLIAMAHRTAYVMQSTIAHPNHMIEGFIEGLMAKRPALFNCYTSCQPEHGIGDDMGHHQAKLAVESRAYPLFRYHPDHGVKPEDCFELEGNPDMQADWPTYPLTYHEGGRDKQMQLPMTFADFAITEVRFRKHFRMAPPDTWHENMVPLVQYIELNPEEREGKFPFIWTVDRKQQLSRLLVDQTMVRSTEDRRNFWHMLKAIAAVDKQAVDMQAIENKIRQEVIAKISQGMMQWITGGEQAIAPAISEALETTSGTRAAAPTGEYMAPWIDSEDCTACDECIKINSNIFAYNEDKHAYIKDPNGGPYKDLVKAAEKCTAQIIHPGLPKNRNEKDIDKWIERGKKHN
ncbi:MAG: pyruvate ferredoxin oxidoreductase [Gammaproteobacteria bacterium SG8_11]|nr:MAG: pyruvate ferredoxin oxidoreductase [Gammaproteobacteria bacterium SG8_11]